ncbi:PREDICTED: putative uncharacterized [Prunus dulcis]|uniref:PREDICTED: putative uncharacterized n=1 Tax=Prunus dulcis TaxID=3755 RepID=A0A5E4FMU2_PRUDU|nr:PREDICTED: putative uncharacterized [Prunus dulcis]
MHPRRPRTRGDRVPRWGANPPPPSPLVTTEEDKCTRFEEGLWLDIQAVVTATTYPTMRASAQAADMVARKYSLGVGIGRRRRDSSGFGGHNYGPSKRGGSSSSSAGSGRSGGRGSSSGSGRYSSRPAWSQHSGQQSVASTARDSSQQFNVTTTSRDLLEPEHASSRPCCVKVFFDWLQLKPAVRGCLYCELSPTATLSPSISNIEHNLMPYIQPQLWYHLLWYHLTPYALIPLIVQFTYNKSLPGTLLVKTNKPGCHLVSGKAFQDLLNCENSP